MFESFVITLREGIEAALVVGIILVFLRRTGRSRLERWVYSGLGTAVAASILAAALLHRLPINEEAYEGTLMLLASGFVASMVIWMWRAARRMKVEIEGRLEAVTSADGDAAGWGLFALTFLLVFREGAETILLLVAVQLTTTDILAFLGGASGLALAVLFGVALVKGSIRIDLGRFFRVTGIVLLVFAAHHLAGALHEFAEAGLIPIGRRTMRILGPIVKSQALVLASMLALPLIVFLVPGRGGAEPVAAKGPARRLQMAHARRDRRWRGLAGAAGLAVIVALTGSMAYSRFPRTFEAPSVVAVDAAGEVRLPLAGLDDGHLHRFGVEMDGVLVRFLIMQAGGRLRATFDACQVCGAYGYVESSGRIVCLACAADINPTTLGAEGGCNPLPLPMQVEGDFLVIRADDLRPQREVFATATGTPAAPVR